MREFRVAPWARARQEDFGLLFYDTRSTTMTYIRSGPCLVAPPVGDPGRPLLVVAGSAEEEARVAQVLERLEAKGLVCAVEPH